MIMNEQKRRSDRATTRRREIRGHFFPFVAPSLRHFVALSLLLFASPIFAATGKLSFYFIDTEGGASTLIVTPAGESVLIDTGNPGERDPGRIVDATRAAGLTAIDYLIVTHYHVDHMGGAPTLGEWMPIH